MIWQGMLGSTHRASSSKADAAALATSTVSPGDGAAIDSSDLPASVYKYSRWHELESAEVKGSMLHSPRIREGPQNVPSLYASHSVSLQRDSARRRDHRNTLENWEQAESVNFSYQDLGDAYQVKNFHRCLKRLVRCRNLQLMSNSLNDLGRITFPSCTHLNLAKNNITSFKKLPKAPQLEHLSLSDNGIASLSGLSSLASKCPLKSLVLKGNPVEFTEGYRHSVFKALPHLVLLDGYPRLPPDLEGSHSSASSSSSGSNASIHSGTALCTIC